MENKSIVGPFPSRMSNTCSQCNVTVHKFAPIYFYKNRRTKEEIAQGVKPQGAIVIHESCFSQFQDAQKWMNNIQWTVRAAGSTQDEDATEDVPTTPSEPVKTSPVATVPSIQPQGSDLASIIAASVLPLVQAQLSQKLDTDAVQGLIDKALKSFQTPVKRIEVLNPALPEILDLGLQHKQFPSLLQRIGARSRHTGSRLNHWITGSAGTGKTSAVEMAAKALGLSYAFTGSLSEEYKVLGHISPGTGEAVVTAFLKAWEFGGVFLFDDFDGSDPIAALGLNTPLAGQWCAFPDGRMVKRHTDCVLVLTANTWGYGATSDYVGRLKQDGAFLDRFVKLHWEVDEDLERETCGMPEWAKRVQQVRRNVASKGLKVLVTPRASYHGVAMLDAGLSWKETEMATMGASMTSEQWNMVK